jgi:hypothetical protein
MVFFPYTAIALIPDICWSKARWMAKKIAILLVTKNLFSYEFNDFVFNNLLFLSEYFELNTSTISSAWY